jgi:transcriptional regulator with XRE-family HTH domain
MLAMAETVVKAFVAWRGSRSQTEVARLIAANHCKRRCTPQAVSQWESGRRRPDGDSKMAIELAGGPPFSAWTQLSEEPAP